MIRPDPKTDPPIIGPINPEPPSPQVECEYCRQINPADSLECRKCGAPLSLDYRYDEEFGEGEECEHDTIYC